MRRNFRRRMDDVREKWNDSFDAQPVVLSGAAQPFWDDMKRLYPESCADDRVPGTDSLNGHGCRFGRVSRRYVRGQWWVWEKGEWRREK